MPRLFKLSAVLIAIFITTTYAQSYLSNLTNANNDFGFRIFAEIIRQSEVKNIFIAPTSIAMALSMTYNGADLATKDSMAKTLGVTDLSINQFNQANLELRKTLTNKNKKVILNIANSLWADKGTQFKKEFLSINKKYYNAQVTTLNFADPKSVNKINKWVNNATNKKIKKIIDEIGENVIAFLINAIYFKGVWQNQFDKNKTTEQTFYCFDGTEKKHPMMHQDGRYLYLENKNFQAISLPYANSDICFYIFLPTKEYDIKQFLSDFNSENWLKWMNQFRMLKGSITLPRFKLEYEKSLKDVLKAMGMEIAFDDSRANFTKMASSQIKGNIYIGDVKHKTFVEVNEQGTEAAAVTSVHMEVKAVQETFNMIVDRPFFCSIVDNKTNAILFIGVITEPK